MVMWLSCFKLPACNMYMSVIFPLWWQRQKYMIICMLYLQNFCFQNPSNCLTFPVTSVLIWKGCCMELWNSIRWGPNIQQCTLNDESVLDNSLHKYSYKVKKAIRSIFSWYYNPHFMRICFIIHNHTENWHATASWNRPDLWSCTRLLTLTTNRKSTQLYRTVPSENNKDAELKSMTQVYLR